MPSEQIFDRAAEAARLVMMWRNQAEALRAGGAIAGVDRRRALALARRCETEVYNLSIAAEREASNRATDWNSA